MVNILIADDHFLVRKGLRQLLEENIPLSCLDEAEDGIQALEKAKKRHFDLIVLDYSMPGREGLDLVRDLKDIDPTTHILILSMLPEEQYALRAFRLGASGCVNKAIDPGDLVAAVKTVAAGHRYLGPRASEILLEGMASGSEEPHEKLSDREFQILKLLALGKSVGEIAGMLSLSVKTVSTYRSRILEKMNMENNSQLMNYAFKKGLVG
ncbi:MAG TPA: response regulator transcription factor [Rectinemataceae bacterium]